MGSNPTLSAILPCAAMHGRCLHKYRNGYSTMLAYLSAGVLRPNAGRSSAFTDLSKSGRQMDFASMVMVARTISCTGATPVDTRDERIIRKDLYRPVRRHLRWRSAGFGARRRAAIHLRSSLRREHDGVRESAQGKLHPPPWRAARSGLGYDVEVELAVPGTGTLPGGLSREDAIWLIAAHSVE